MKTTKKHITMKKYFIYMLMALSAIAINSCGDDAPAEEQPGTELPENPDNPDNSDASDEPSGNSNILIAYFTHTNNTGTVAERIAELTGGTLYRIETVTPYPDDYNECTQVAREQLDNGTRPELSGTVEDMEQYNIVFVGCPVWWGDAPMPVWSFLESKAYDFAGNRHPVLHLRIIGPRRYPAAHRESYPRI